MRLVTADQRAGRLVTGMNAIIRDRFMELPGKVHFGRPQADDPRFDTIHRAGAFASISRPSTTLTPTPVPGRKNSSEGWHGRNRALIQPICYRITPT